MTAVRIEHDAEHGHPHMIVSASVPEGYDSTTSSTFLLPGRGMTPGALGLIVPEAGAGILFTHEDPSQGLHIPAASVDEFAGLALTRQGQELDTSDFSGGREEPELARMSDQVSRFAF